MLACPDMLICVCRQGLHVRNLPDAWTNNCRSHCMRQHRVCSSVPRTFHTARHWELRNMWTGCQGIGECGSACKVVARNLFVLSPAGPLRPRCVQQARRRCSCQLRLVCGHVDAQKLICLQHRAGAQRACSAFGLVQAKTRAVLQANNALVVASSKLRRTGCYAASAEQCTVRTW